MKTDPISSQMSRQRDMSSHISWIVFQRLKSHLAANDEKIDLILIDYSNRDALISISHLVDYPPIVVMTPFNHPATFNTIMGNLQSPSLAPYDLTPYDYEMSLHQRVSNILGYAFSRIIENFYFEPEVNGYLRDHFGPRAPTLVELESKISVALVNTHPASHCQRPVLPSIVDVGFLHIAPPKSLAKVRQPRRRARSCSGMNHFSGCDDVARERSLIGYS